MTTERPGQPSLPFPSAPLTIPLVEGEARLTAAASILKWLERRVGENDPGTGQGHVPILLLLGPRGAGKSRLLADILAARHGQAVPSELLEGRPADLAAPLLGIDDAQSVPAMRLFAFANEAMLSGRSLILAGAGSVATWGQGVPGEADLRSRLGAAFRVTMTAPDEATMALALARALHAAGLNLPFAAVSAAAAGLRRDFHAVEDIARSAHALSAEFRTPKALLAAAMADNPQHCLG